MFARYVRFVRALSINWVGSLGSVLTTTAVLTFFVLEAARLTGILTNAYIGLVTYLVFPAMFVAGLILIPIGWRRARRQTGLTTRELLDERFDDSDTRRGFFGSRVFLGIGALTVVNALVFFLAASRTVAFMDSARFCGTACHSVMNPEWVTYQASPHARVKCVECHVGEGVDALIDSKLSGLRQVVSVTFDLYEKPIPTPVHNLRPARETCEHCHWPDKFYGVDLETIVRYGMDEASTPRYTTLGLKIDAGRDGGYRSGIHWHIAAENEVRYASVDDEREEMVWVESRRPDGSYRRYVNRSRVGREGDAAVRVMDCVDCHNRATHVYEHPHDAVDRRLERGEIDRSLPFIRRESLAAITTRYAGGDAAMEGIAAHLHGFYRRYYPDVARSRGAAIDGAVRALRSAYRRNIHHGMNITWGAYPSLLGHRAGGGCFRCHNPDMVDAEGRAISDDCTMCHSMLAFESPDPFAYLDPADTTVIESGMASYLRGEFLRSYVESE